MGVALMPTRYKDVFCYLEERAQLYGWNLFKKNVAIELELCYMLNLNQGNGSLMFALCI